MVARYRVVDISVDPRDERRRRRRALLRIGIPLAGVALMIATLRAIDPGGRRRRMHRLSLAL
jgi:hypothetical protein